MLDVSERVSFLVREEIELAKAEITEKATQLVRGSVVGIVAGVFALLGFAMLMHAFAWLLNELFFEDDVWLGFRSRPCLVPDRGVARASSPTARCRPASPPAPTMAIEEAKEIRRDARGRAPMADSPELVPRPAGGVDRPAAPGAGTPDAPTRSAPTSSASARSSAARSRRSAAA